MPSSSLFLHQVLSYTPLSSSSSSNKSTRLRASSDNNISQPNPTIKVPTPPWMNRPLRLQPYELLKLSQPRNKKLANNTNLEKSDKALTKKESGVRGHKAMKGIVRSIGKLQKNHNFLSTYQSSEASELGESLEQLGGEAEEELGRPGKRLPWVREERAMHWRVKKERVVTKAELSLDKELLLRLKAEARTMRTWIKVKKAGVTQSVVDLIRLAWTRNELAMVKFDIPLCRSMGRAMEILEMKTGGFVIWTRKDVHVIYRGSNYHLMKNSGHSTMDKNVWRGDSLEESLQRRTNMEANTQPINGSLFQRETDRLLDGLGPRFVDWWMQKPLPIDADLLPEVVTGFQPPYRLCPPRSRSKLNDNELTYLRKLARALPTHFVLGRNRKLQGLAAAIIRLWEKSIIAKISVKYGIPNTDNEQMADELKRLTGGVLLLRNKFYIILYRGKDFLPYQIASMVEDRESELRQILLSEEDARLKPVDSRYFDNEPTVNTSKVGTLNEFQNIQSKFGVLGEIRTKSELQLEAEKEKIEKELRIQEHKHSILKRKIEMMERELAKLNSAWTPAERDADQEIMTKEERRCFRKIGLKMRSTLVLGRRGVFAGVMEAIHQHWKHREVVKVITMQRKFAAVFDTAKRLEAESGGLLVSVDKLKEGHSIIIFRGKNYKRPPRPLMNNLLTKREALRRSLLMQSIGSLKFFAHQRQLAISEMKSKLAELQESKERTSNFHELEDAPSIRQTEYVELP